MCRHTRLLLPLLSIGLLCGLTALAAPPQQRCPFQMQMWYQVQMQQWSFQQQQMQMQQAMRGQQVQQHRLPEPPRPVQRAVGHPAPVGLNLQARLTHEVHSTVQTRPRLTLHPVDIAIHPASRPGFHLAELRPETLRLFRPELSLEKTTTTHHALHLSLTATLHHMTPQRLETKRRVEPREPALQRAVVERPEVAMRKKTERVSGERPTVKVWTRLTCAARCHGEQGPPSQPLQGIGREPQDLLAMQLQRLQRPVPRRPAQPPDLLLVEMQQRLRPQPPLLPLRPGLPGQTARIDYPPWLRALDPPPLPLQTVQMLRPQGYPTDTPGRSVVSNPASPGTRPSSLSSEGKMVLSPTSPAVTEETTRAALDEAAELPPPPPATGAIPQLLWPTPSVLAAPSEDADATPETTGSLEALLESPPPPPTMGALLAPPQLADSEADEEVARLPGTADLDALLESSPPSRD